jgi:hypothetical protein
LEVKKRENGPVNWMELIENRLVDEKIASEEKEEKASKGFGMGCLFEM